VSSGVPRALVVTFAVVSLVTVTLATICFLPSAGIRPLRAWTLDLDELAPTAAKTP
jgi:hypothetical protein